MDVDWFPSELNIRSVTTQQQFKMMTLLHEAINASAGTAIMRTTTRLIASRAENVGVLALNNPKSLHALTSDMVHYMHDILQDWKQQQQDKSPLQAIVIKSTSAKRPAFCAGGDVKTIYEKENYRFFYDEYQLNHAIATSSIPIVSLWDGVVMGGGVGISIHGKYRIATENTLFAMPETALGLFPDIGSMFWMPRLLSKPMANYLALTGARIRAYDLVHFGLATHYLPSDELPNLEKALVEATSSHQPQNRQAVADILQSFHRSVEANEDSVLFKNQEQIESVFAADTMERIVQNLEQGKSDFEQETLASLQRMSPTSLKVTLEGLRRGAKCQTLAQDIQMEYRMAKGFITMSPKSDFYEGVRSILIDRDHNPKWNPPTLEDVTDERVEAFFAPVDDELLIISEEESNQAASKL
ncbi:MAG: hypothetical protein SGBAC_012823 [Bacillariaceae sp.]